MNTLSDRLAPALDLLREILLEPAFSDEALEVWRGQEKARIRSREDDPGALAFSEFNRLMYRDHPVGWVMGEDEISPDRVSRARIESLHATLYCRDRLVVGVSGDVRWDEAERLLGDFISAWSPCEAPLPSPPRADVRSEPGVFILPRPVEQSTIIAAESSTVRLDDSPTYFASRIADFVLGGGGPSSRITSRIRGEEGLAYGAASVWTAPILYDGLLGGLTASGAATTVRATRVLLEVMQDLRDAPPTDTEVREAVETIAAGYAFAFESPAQIVARQVAYRLQRLPRDWLTRYLEGIQEVTSAQVAAVVRDHLEPERMTILIVGDPSRFGPGLEELGPLYELSADGSYRPWINPPFAPGGSPRSLP
jgi:predicted Zn-dependent peptidase